MIQRKLKTCSGCQQEKVIWKAHGRDKYCRDCWYQQQPPKKIQPVASKRKEEMTEYSKRRLAYLAMFPHCQLKLPGCTHQATEIHHTKGRENDLLLEIKYFKSACRHCHDWVTEHSAEAIEMGLSVSRLKNAS